jgi:hypothetical protein
MRNRREGFGAQGHWVAELPPADAADDPDRPARPGAVIEARPAP